MDNADQLVGHCGGRHIRLTMSDDLRDWYDQGRERGFRWLLITFDHVDRELAPRYRTEMEGAVWEGGNLWTCQWIIDLDLPLQPQRKDVYLAEEP